MLEQCFTDSCGAAQRFENELSKCGRQKLRQISAKPKQNSAEAIYIPKRRCLSAEGKQAAMESPLIVGGLNELANAVVGKGRRLKPEFNQTKLGWTDEEYTEVVDATKSLWRQDMYSKRRWIDQEGDQTLPAMQKMVLKNTIACGETYTAAFWFNDSVRPFRTSLSIMDDDRIRTPTDLPESRKETTIAGHALGPTGRTFSYFVHDYHRNDPRNCDSPERYTEVRRLNDFGREQIIHTRIKKQPGLTRGISDLASAFGNLKCFEQYKKARLEKVLMELSIALVIKSNDKNALGQIFNNGPVSDEQLQALYALSMKKAVQSQRIANETKLNIDGTKAIRLLENEELEVVTASTSSNNDKQFVDDCLNDIARSTGMSKSTLTQDFDASFSSARASLISFYREVDNLGCYIVDDWTQSVYTVWLEDVIQSGRLVIPGYPNPMEAWMHFVMERESYCNASFCGPARMEIDATKAAQAAKVEQEIGGFSYQEYYDTHKGVDYKDAFKQKFEELKEWNKLLVDCGYEALTKYEALVFLRPNFSTISPSNGGPVMQSETETETEQENDTDTDE